MGELTIEIQTPVGREGDIASFIQQFTPASQAAEITTTQQELDAFQKSAADYVPVFVAVMQLVGWYVDSTALWAQIKAYVMRAHENEPGTGPFIVRMKCNEQERELIIELEDAEAIRDALATFREVCRQNGP